MECIDNFSPMYLFISEEKEIQVVGRYTYLFYFCDENFKPASIYQIKKSYENAVKKLGGEVLFDAPQYATYKIEKNNVTAYVVWRLAYSSNDSDCNEYTLEIVEPEEMEQLVNADDLLRELESSGFATIYINFASGSSELPSDASSTIDALTELLSNNPDLRISIEGHTDDVGSPESNLSLSEDRAGAVRQALIENGIDESRLSFTGWGEERPVSDNTSDQGRAQNRRVEIIKL
jgi:outer membrane protein OmpA-like peptidoglycan-associated protein